MSKCNISIFCSTLLIKKPTREHVLNWKSNPGAEQRQGAIYWDPLQWRGPTKRCAKKQWAQGYTQGSKDSGDPGFCNAQPGPFLTGGSPPGANKATGQGFTGTERGGRVLLRTPLQTNWGGGGCWGYPPLLEREAQPRLLLQLSPERGGDSPPAGQKPAGCFQRLPHRPLVKQVPLPLRWAHSGTRGRIGRRDGGGICSRNHNPRKKI